MCGADGFPVHNDSLDMLVRNNEGETPPHRKPDAQTHGDRVQRAGQASVSPGRGPSFIDHSCLSGPRLPLRLQNVSQPSSSICLLCGDPSVLHSSAHRLEAVPQTLRKQDAVFVGGGGLFVCFCLSLALNVAPGLDSEALTTPGLLPGAHATGDLPALPSGAVKCPVLLQAIAGIHLSGSLDYVDTHGRIYQSPKSSGPALGTIRKLPRGSLHRLLTRTLTRPVTHSEQKN